MRVAFPPDTEPRPTWQSCLEAARASRAYVSTCLATLCNPAGTLPPEQKAAKDDFEWRTPLHLLKPLREASPHSGVTLNALRC